ncbi:MAG: tRNA glutamyl-Q(34) synthetase GluQRS [Methylococcales bacterium]|nr:tRNA glutamyl-Q(34) synthetase GluQRS [Methylococcales bacterium]MBT3698502.1 tRNA glutamyl-Q(34) synthetase GluQRS [Methylococcales bacterium]MBT3815408.1 tRNA glutamyl-Q(34) synthetase GluQRS [Methylococcales bacterium]MBT4032334.1 tRNA glutamyl-Q(34) synthetase GluQRS [Methylococcales bacterium]MBT4348669.1 tRNA glutamyl-Q(34) synthetase GluQRS [Methylococcales bacterium]
MPTKNAYIGRFAPSPTGPLHLGSLFTALASFLQARKSQGRWLLRIDDLDTPRLAPGAIENILTTLDAYGLHWDGEVAYESQWLEHYQNAIDQLTKNDLTYPCTCSRKQLARYRLRKPETITYPEFCRTRQHSRTNPHSLRIKTPDQIISVFDALHGQQQQKIHQEIGDFIIKRRDHIFSYQLAVVVSDHLQNITEIVRGIDLLDSTPRQVFLQQQLGFATPHYQHVPIIVDALGAKLSKQAFANPVHTKNMCQTLIYLLTQLQQNPPHELTSAPLNELLDWAISSWDIKRLEKISTINL